MFEAKNIHFYFQNTGFNLANRIKLKSFIKGIFKSEKTKLESLSFIFCKDKYLLKINQEYLNHDSLTDIISFNYAGPQKPVQGEIYISVDRVRENAVLFNSSLTQELLRVIFHGSLHLCGYKDNTPSQKREMRKKENFYLQLYILSRN